MDFTLKRYKELLEALQTGGYQFVVNGSWFLRSSGCSGERARNMVHGSNERIVFLRHDVDLKPENSLATAWTEARLGIRATYYFRAVQESWDEKIIQEIAQLKHSIGYHYESLTTCNGDVDKAYEDFCMNLERLRKLVPVKTICMHGSPRSPWDSKGIWHKYDYHKLGINFEPYLDTDWSQMLYLTDTGRRWDGYKVSMRDKIPHWQDEWNKRGLSFHSTEDIITNLNAYLLSVAKLGESQQVGANPNVNPNLNVSGLPERIMITTHPQRWTDDGSEWLRELVTQNMKNVVKRLLVMTKSK